MSNSDECDLENHWRECFNPDFGRYMAWVATGTSQAPQLVAPEANIRRDDHRGLHDARRRFNLAKSHGTR